MIEGRRRNELIYCVLVGLFLGVPVDVMGITYKNPDVSLTQVTSSLTQTGQNQGIGIFGDHKGVKMSQNKYEGGVQMKGRVEALQKKAQKKIDIEEEPIDKKAGYVNINRAQYDAASRFLKDLDGPKYAIDNVPALVRRFLSDFVSECERTQDLMKSYDTAREKLPLTNTKRIEKEVMS